MALSAFIVLWPLQGLAESAWNGPVPLRDIPMPPPQQRYPAKNTSTVKEAYSHTAEWEGRAVAMEGTIKSIEVDDRGHPSIELLLAQDGAMTIWATWPLTNTKGMDSFLRVGERLRVLGWLRDSVAWAKVTHLDLPRQNPMTLLPICLVKVHNSDALFDSKYLEFCDAWQKGFMPPNMAR